MAIAPEDAIRARRRLTNKLIAAHDATRLRPFIADDARLIAGDGGLILGAQAILEAFAGQFRDPDFQTYVRDPETVDLDDAGQRAAETGRWTARWKAGQMGGRYLACWRKETGQWLIESELFITLTGVRTQPFAGQARVSSRPCIPPSPRQSSSTLVKATGPAP